MKLRNLLALVLAMLLVGLGLIAFLARRKMEHDVQAFETIDSAPQTREVASGLPTGTPTGLPTGTPADREKRAELRRKILEAWAKGEMGPEIAEEAKQGRFEEHPNADGSGIDPKYIQAEMREQMFPMARACYEDYLSRQRDAGGTVTFSFKIVADDKLGGIVEEDDEHDGGIVSGMGDDKMATCMRESMMTVTFPPPAKGGVVTIGYPIVFSPGDDDEHDE